MLCLLQFLPHYRLLYYFMIGRYESQAIQRIVQDILSRNLKLLHVGDKLIGMERRLKEMGLLIPIDSNDVQVIGIYGIDGIGKTTLAKVVYNEIVR